ncbi:protein kinase [Nonomuraea phyllanthi]|nr:protein kinase [Nonomuraea phyllanthi]
MGETCPLRPEDPKKVGDFEIVGLVGEGPRGPVYLGKRGNDRVAIKVLPAVQKQNDAVLKQLTSASGVSSSYTARVIEAGWLEKRPYLVREYVEGPTLWETVEADGPLTGDALERVTIGTLTALTVVRLAGMVHRAITPHNIVLSADGPRLLDLGVGEPAEHTPYQAPEQIRDEPSGAAADVFSWAATMVFAATGKAPFADGDAVLTEKPDLGDITQPLRRVLVSCLAKDVVQRPTAQNAMLKLLGDKTADTLVAGPPPASSAGRAGLAAGTGAVNKEAGGGAKAKADAGAAGAGGQAGPAAPGQGAAAHPGTVLAQLSGQTQPADAPGGAPRGAAAGGPGLQGGPGVQGSLAGQGRPGTAPMAGGPSGGPGQLGPMTGGPAQQSFMGPAGPMGAGPGLQGWPGPVPGGQVPAGPPVPPGWTAGPGMAHAAGPMPGGFAGGPVQGGPVQGGPVQGGPVQGGPVQGGPVGPVGGPGVTGPGSPADQGGRDAHIPPGHQGEPGDGRALEGVPMSPPPSGEPPTSQMWAAPALAGQDGQTGQPPHGGDGAPPVITQLQPLGKPHPRRKFPVGLVAAVGTIVVLSGAGLWGAGTFAGDSSFRVAAESSESGGQNGLSASSSASAAGQPVPMPSPTGVPEQPQPEPQVTAPWATTAAPDDSPLPMNLPNEWQTAVPTNPAVIARPTPPPVQTPSALPTQPTPLPSAVPSQVPQVTRTVTVQPSPSATTETATPTPTASATSAPTPTKDRPGEEPSSAPTQQPTQPPAQQPSQEPTQQPTASKPAPTNEAKNPYSPTQVCGAGFSVQRSSAFAGGVTYQLWNNGTQQNCVVTMKTKDVGKSTPVSATLYVQGGSPGSASDSGNFEYYAGPVKLKAPGKCVKYSGSTSHGSTSVDWANCG